MYAYLTSNFLQKPQGIRMMTLMGYEIYIQDFLFVWFSTCTAAYSHCHPHICCRQMKEMKVVMMMGCFVSAHLVLKFLSLLDNSTRGLLM